MNQERAYPVGWRAFRLLRQRPADIPRLRHGNYRHGEYSKGSAAGLKKVRALVRVLPRPPRFDDWAT